VEVGELHELLSKIKEIEDAVANGQVLPLAATTPDVLEAARALFDQIQEATKLVEALETAESDWRVSCASSAGNPRLPPSGRHSRPCSATWICSSMRARPF